MKKLQTLAVFCGSSTGTNPRLAEGAWENHARYIHSRRSDRRRNGEGTVLRDVGLKDGKIVRIGGVAEEAETVVDASGLALCPGFIDMHTHMDLELLRDKNPRRRYGRGSRRISWGRTGSALLLSREEQKAPRGHSLGAQRDSRGRKVDLGLFRRLSERSRRMRLAEQRRGARQPGAGAHRGYGDGGAAPLPRRT